MITSTRKALKPCFAAEAHKSQPLPARKASRPLCILHTSRWSRSTFPCIACTTARGNIRVQRGQRQKIAHRKFTFCVSYFRAMVLIQAIQSGQSSPRKNTSRIKITLPLLPGLLYHSGLRQASHLCNAPMVENTPSSDHQK